MYVKELLIAAFVLLLKVGIVESQGIYDGGRKLVEPATYFIVSPTRIYPDEEVQVSVSILYMKYPSVNVRASIQKGNQEFASDSYMFNRVTTRLLQMKMPADAVKGKYTLRVEGSVGDDSVGNFIFENDTVLEFFEKPVAVFIQTNKPTYKGGQTVYFRVVPVKPNLLPGTSMVDVYVEDATNTTVRRWLSLQPTSGVLDMNFKLDDQVNYGTWRLRLVIKEAEYYKHFEVKEFYGVRFDVNVTVPNYIMDRGWGLPMIIQANETTGRPVVGNATIYMKIQNARQSHNPYYKPIHIQRDIKYFTGRYDTFVSLEELKRLIGSEEIADYEVFINVSCQSWWWLQNNTGYAYSYIYGSEVSLEFLGNEVVPFKPGMQYSAYLAASRMDGSPLRTDDSRSVMIRRTITGGQYARTDPDERYVIPDSGILDITITTPVDSEGVRIEAFYEKDYSITAVQHAIMAYSPSKSYIQVTTSTVNPLVNQYMVFTVRTNNYVEYVYYQIVAAGRIVIADRLAMTARQKTFSVAVSRDMIPRARIVAYHIRTDNEVVADALNFFVNGTRTYDVDVSINKGKDFSGATAQLSGITEPGTYISFAGIDMDQYLHGGTPFLTEDEVIDELSTFDGNANSTYSYQWFYSDDYSQTIYFPASSYATDTNLTFKYAGLVAFTDANITRLPHKCNETAGELPCSEDRTCYSIAKRCDLRKDCKDGSDEIGCQYPKQSGRRRHPYSMMKLLRRHYTDTSWLWKSYLTKPDGRVDITTQVPNDIPMAWMVSAFAVSRESGLSLMPRPKLFDAVQPFIMVVEMPSHARLGEQVGVRVAVFNYWNDYFECVVTLHDSTEYKMVNVEPFGLVNSYRPRTSFGDQQTLLYLEPGQSASIYLAVLPIVRGKVINVKVSAATFIGSDEVVLPLFVSYDGVTNHYHTPYMVDLLRTGSNILPDLDIVVPEQFTKPEQRKHLFVPGSGKAIIKIVGDIVGPGFFEDHLNTENLLEKPYGSGEEAVYNMAVNMYYLLFLKNTAQLSEQTKVKGLEYVNLALQRLMSYYNPEGYISAFRDHQVPSLWLTAFALNSLHDSHVEDWTYELFIPVELLNELATWIIAQQNPDTGAFQQIGPLYDLKMKQLFDISVKGMITPANVSITAFTLIALAKSKDALTGTASTLAPNAINSAAGYLADQLPNIEDTFQIAITAYALQLAEHSKKSDAFQKLKNRRREENDFMYWTYKELDIDPVIIVKVDTVPFYQPRREGPWDGYACQATSYALQTYLENNLRTSAYPTMKWLQYMRTTMGGQASTQDSIVALQALTRYAAQDATRRLYSIQFSVEATSTAFWLKKVSLTKANFADLQTVEIPNIWGSVKVTVEGTGLATIALDTYINVEFQELLKAPEGEFFNIRIADRQCSGRNCSILEMTTCASWRAPSIAPTSGMAVIEVDIPSGHIVLNADLRQYVMSNHSGLFRHAEFKDSKVTFYLEHIGPRESCVKFRADRWYPVANVSLYHRVRVYDYFEPGRYAQTVYQVRNLFNLGVCHVCASFQCPYCADYNAATTVVTNMSLFVFAVLFAIYKNVPSGFHDLILT